MSDRDPWNIIARPIFELAWRYIDRVPPIYTGEGIKDTEPFELTPLGVVERKCPACKNVTEQEDFYWAIEAQYTRECRGCGAVWEIE